MLVSGRLSKCVACLTAFNLVVTSSLVSAESVPSKSGSRSHDLTLDANGTLVGVVLDARGLPVAGAAVRVLHRNGLIAQTKADRNGRFAVRGLRTGLHAVTAGKTHTLVRFRTRDTVPPGANSQALVLRTKSATSGNQRVVRGQTFDDPYGDDVVIDLEDLLNTALIATTLGFSIYAANEASDSRKAAEAAARFAQMAASP